MDNIKKKCYIYTRVSTDMQVDGYSLDAQMERLKREAEYRELEIAGIFSDAGKSGKNVKGRPEFTRMLECVKKANADDIEIRYVMVFKLSRFGRNAKDVLVSLETMRSYGCDLICVEDGIDSSKEAGKLMISVLSSVAEIERENIRVQTMEGRNQKAREGKWNGGRPPYGYKLVNVDGENKLEIDAEAAEIVKLIYDKFVNTRLGANGIAKYLNDHGYQKEEVIGNSKLDGSNRKLTSQRFSAHFIKLVLDNPTYAGFIAYNRRINERVRGSSEEEYHRVRNKDYDIYEGIHKAIIDKEIWALAQQKREETGVKHEKIYGKEREHLLSGLLKCPQCGKNMYGKRSSMKKRKDGSYYPVTFCYFCKNRYNTDTLTCDYRKQPPQGQIDEEVMAMIMEASSTEVIKSAISDNLNKRLDRETIEREIMGVQKEYDRRVAMRERLAKLQDELDPFDEKNFERKYQEIESKKDKCYDDMQTLAEKVEELKNKQKLSIDREAVIESSAELMKFFKEKFSSIGDSRKKQFLGELLEKVEIYPEKTKEQRWVKSITFKVPVVYRGKEVRDIMAEEFWCNYQTPDETVCLLLRKAPV